MTDPSYDWEAAERSQEFQALVHSRRRFVIPATAFFLAWYLAFVLLAGYAKDFMGSSIYEGFTVGYALALSQFVMVWVLAWAYLRKADRDFEPLERAAAEKAMAVAGDAPRTGAGRFERTVETDPETTPEATR
jgi:uncharacterized membrane protein (DUF485 family)